MAGRGGGALPAEAARAALFAAATFLEREGGAAERRELAVLLGERAPSAFAALVAAEQEEDGRVRPLAAGPGAPAEPGVASTAHALERLAGVGALDTAPAEAAARALRAAQAGDGLWAAGEAAPPEAKLATTGLLAGLLARTPGASPAAVRRAAMALGAGWRVPLVQGGTPEALEAIAGYLGALSNLAEDALPDEVLQWCGRELERGFRTGAFPPAEVARVFALADAAALPGARLGAAEVAEALRREQAGDGGFPDAPPRPARGAPGGRAEATRRAAAALAQLAPSG